MRILAAVAIVALATAATALADDNIDLLVPILQTPDRPVSDHPAEPARKTEQPPLPTTSSSALPAPILAPAAPPAKTPDTPKSPPAEPKQSTIEVDRKARRIAIDGQFTGAVSLVENGAVGPTGKAYVSAIQVAARPIEIREAMESLGVEPGQVPAVDDAGNVTSPPKGRPVKLFIEWTATIDGKATPMHEPMETFFWNRPTDKVLPQATWIYAGSKAIQDKDLGFELLVANLSGTVATINRKDTSALFYYGGELPVSKAFHMNPGYRPDRGTPCRLVIELADKDTNADAAAPAPESAAPAAEPPAVQSAEAAATDNAAGETMRDDE